MTTTVQNRRPDRFPTDLRVLGVEIAEGLRAIVREPATLFFSVLMPVLFFALFASLFGDQPSTGGIPAGATMLATFGTFTVVSVMLVNPGVTVADERTRGWLRVKKVSATPISAVITAKVVAALPYAGFALLAISGISLLVVGPVLDLVTWLRLVGVLLLGSLPFALFGLAVGFVASANATVAILNAVLFPIVVAAGLWFPPEMLPGFVRAVAPVLPTYHLAQLALAQLTGTGGLGHLVALLVSTLVGAVLAGLAYRNLRV
jgi:ABC-2 type transport system permease protein